MAFEVRFLCVGSDVDGIRLVLRLLALGVVGRIQQSALAVVLGVLGPAAEAALGVRIVLKYEVVIFMAHAAIPVVPG